MKKKCNKCNAEVEPSQLNHNNECSYCENKRRDEEDDQRRTNGMLMGDWLGIGIPGGIDMDVTTPL